MRQDLHIFIDRNQLKVLSKLSNLEKIFKSKNLFTEKLPIYVWTGPYNVFIKLFDFLNGPVQMLFVALLGSMRPSCTCKQISILKLYVIGEVAVVKRLDASSRAFRYSS